MNRSTSPLLLSNRLASRRLHRRPQSARSSAYAPVIVPVSNTPNVIAGLPASVVREAGMFELLAAEMRIAELERALAEARDAALTDSLTGAFNRRGFDQASQREVARASRSGLGFAIAHIDLDDFKRINDSLGHAAGDRALSFLVARLRASLRPMDIIARFGGEEFVVMLPETGCEDAVRVLNRFLEDFSTRCVPGLHCCLSFSAGVSVSAGKEALEDVIQRADAAMYEAKRQGKRRVMAA